MNTKKFETSIVGSVQGELAELERLGHCDANDGIDVTALTYTSGSVLTILCCHL